MTGLALLLTLISAPAAPDTVPGVMAEVRPATLETELGAIHDRLSGDRDDWRELYLRLSRPLMPRGAIVGEGRLVERFGLTDTELRAAAYLPVRGSHSLELEGSVAPGAEVLPEWTLGAHLQLGLGAGWTAGGGARTNRYADADLLVATGLVEHYFDVFRAAYRLSVGFLDGERAPSHFLLGSWYYQEGGHVTAGLATGREVERVDPNRLLVTRTGGASIWGVHWISPRLAATYGASFTRHRDLYDRTRIQLGARTRF
jgi:YaiO family outer membrane protein